MDDTLYLAHAAREFRSLKATADRALAQAGDDLYFTQPDPGSNSLALLVKHLAGNLRSRWTDFLTSDGEKLGRRRDAEFAAEAGDTRDALAQRWEAGWAALFAVVESLAPADLSRTVTIRREPLTVFDAIERQKSHYAYHVGQIVYLAKHLAGPHWKTLSIPRGGSDAFNAAMNARR